MNLRSLTRKFLIARDGALLLEVLVAAGIGAVIVASLSQLGTRALRDTSISNKRALTTRLTQQGIEGVRSIRDQNLKNAFIDASCNLIVNPNDPSSDQTYCNEWVDVWKWNYSTPKELKLLPPLSAGNTDNYWKLIDTGVPEIVNGISRKVILGEVSGAEYTKIKKITVISSFQDGGNTFESRQETLLRRLPGT